MRKEREDNWEKLVPDWGKKTPNGNYEIFQLRRWKNTPLKTMLYWIEGGFSLIREREKYCLKHGIPFIRY
jgi:hypothetical protein